MKPINFIQINTGVATSFMNGKLPEVDKKRIVAVYVRQSKTGADNAQGESRETQLSLVDYAAKLLGVDSSKHPLVRLYDEGAGKSGQKRIDQRPELDRLYQDAKAGLIGTVVVAREDRLFRNKHMDQVGMFTDLAEKQSIKCIIPPIISTETVLYDFKIYKHLEAFQEKMRAAYAYLHYQIGYMHANKAKKAARGEFDGRSLPPGYVANLREIGKMQKPMIYEPWAQVMRKIFARAKELDWNLAPLRREIHLTPSLFPPVPQEDLARYVFSVSFKYDPSKPFSPRNVNTVKGWLTNLMFIGWWSVAIKDDNGEITGYNVIKDNHPAIIDRELFEEGYIALTGYNLDGELIQEREGTMKTKYNPDALFHGRMLIVSPNENRKAFLSMDHQITKKGKIPFYVGMFRRTNGMFSDKLFCLRCSDFDKILVNRLKQLAGTDKNILDRINQGLKMLAETENGKLVSVHDSLKKTQKEIAVIRRRLSSLRDLEIDDEKTEKDLMLKLKDLIAQEKELLAKIEAKNIPTEEELTEFHDVLSAFEERYPKLPLAKRQKLFRTLAPTIKAEKLSPHWVKVTVYWINALCGRPDVVLIWRNNPSFAGKIMPDEVEIIDRCYRDQLIIDILRQMPDRSWGSVRSYALKTLDLRREKNNPAHSFLVCATYNDLLIDDKGKYLFGDLETTLEIIRMADKQTCKKGDNLYPLWLLSEDLKTIGACNLNCLACAN